MSKAGTNILVGIVLAFGATLNDLVCDSFPYDHTTYENDLLREVEDCTLQKLRLLSGAVAGAMRLLREHGISGS